jgi:hypothetical protein
MREAVARSFADPRTPRQRVVAGDRHGDREERRTLEASTEVVAYLGAHAESHAEEAVGTGGPASRVASSAASRVASSAASRVASSAASCVDPDLRIGEWPGLGQVCRLVREVEYVSGRRAGETTFVPSKRSSP